jgi:hypothetical protein
MTYINKQLLDEFRRYLDKKGIAYRDGKGEYQALQVNLNSKWEILYLSKETPIHAHSKTDVMSEVVKSFLQTL